MFKQFYLLKCLNFKGTDVLKGFDINSQFTLNDSDMTVLEIIQLKNNLNSKVLKLIRSISDLHTNFISNRLSCLN